MSLKSMTGFARGSGVAGGWQWTWEIKSVNGKGLDSRVRVPQMLDGIDIAIKKLISQHLSRGTVYANLELKLNTIEGETEQTISVNRDNLEELFDLLHEYESTANIAQSSLAQLLAIDGVLDQVEKTPNENQREAIEESVIKGFKWVVEELLKARRAEGSEMQEYIAGHISSLEELIAEASTNEAARMRYVRAAFQEKVNSLLRGQDQFSPERLEQEIAILAVKVDISEELNRLEAHLKSAKDMLKSKTPVGRQYDFLAQELNREVNTLCSKSSDIELTKLGLEMKSQVDMLREQIQNIE